MCWKNITVTVSNAFSSQQRTAWWVIVIHVFLKRIYQPWRYAHEINLNLFKTAFSFSLLTRFCRGLFWPLIKQTQSVVFLANCRLFGRITNSFFVIFHQNWIKYKLTERRFVVTKITFIKVGFSAIINRRQSRLESHDYVVITSYTFHSKLRRQILTRSMASKRSIIHQKQQNDNVDVIRSQPTPDFWKIHLRARQTWRLIFLVTHRSIN